MKDTNVFRQPASGVPTPRPARDRKPLFVFALCLVLGAVLIVRHVSHVVDRERSRAQTETLVRALALEKQLEHSLGAAEVLGAFVRQAGGLLPNFQQRAAELLASRSCVDSMELQPSGVVSDIAPRAGHERALGKNVFNNPATRPGAMTAMQTRRLTVSGPVTLPRGGFAFVGQAPVFVTGRDGREAFWGFAAVTVRLGDVVHRARLDELTAKGYAFLLFAPEQAGQPAMGLVGAGELPRSGCIQQVVQAQNLALRLAVYPRAGWVSLRDLAIWALGVVLVSALVAGMVALLIKRAEISDALSRVNPELVRAREETVQAKAETTRAQDQLARAETQAAQDQRQLARSNEQLTAARDQAAKATEQLARDREDFALAREALIRERDDLAKTNEQLAADVEQFSLVRAQLAREKEQLATTNDQMARDQQELARANEQLVREKEQITQATARLNGDLEKLTRASEQLREQLAKSNEQVARSAEQLTREKESLAQANERTARTEAELKQSALRIEELEQRLAARASEAATPPTADEVEAPAVIVPEPADVPMGGATFLSPQPPAGGDRDVAAPRAMADEQVQKEHEPSSEPDSSPPWEVDAPQTDQEANPAPLPEPAPASESPSVPEPPPGGATSLSPQAPTCGDSKVAAPMPPVELKPAIRTKPPRQKKVRKDDQLSLFGAPEPAETPTVASAPADQPPAKEAAPEPPPHPASAPPASRRVTLVEEPLTEEPAAPQAEPVPPPAAPEPPPAPPVVAAPPTPTEPHPDLPEVEGLDPTAGLASADGNPKHYLKLLRQFVAEQAGAAERIRDLLVLGQPADAARLTHTLRGVAETIGATALRAGASELEHALAGPSDLAEIETIWSAMEKSLTDLVADLKSALKPKEEKAPSLPPPPPVDPPVLRRAVNEILPLLTDLDPGAAECLKANRKTFRSAFSSEGFVEFEQQVKAGAYREALDLLKKAAKKHGAMR